MAAADESKTERRSSPTSTVVYVLFHESSPEAAEIAKAVYDRLRRPDEDVWRSRVGIPVYVRSRSAPPDRSDLMDGTTKPSRVGNLDIGPLRLRSIDLPPAHVPADADYPMRTFVVPLVCDHMGADPRWKGALESLRNDVKKSIENGPTVPRAVMMPVLLGAVGPGVVGLGEDAQVISAFRWTDGGEGPARAVARRERVLRELFLWMIREMRACVEGRTEAGDAPVEIFLSHAKMDGQNGPRVAEHLRDTIASMGHVRGWYDENDLLPGAAWQQLLASAAGGTSAMLAVWSSRYASRPWCRRELTEARRLRRILDATEFERRRAGEPVGHTDLRDLDGLTGGEVFTSVPVVVVDTLAVEGGVTRVPAELATLPTCRWGEEVAGRVVDMAIHEALMSLSNALHARAILALSHGASAPGAPVVAVTSPPDHSLISELVRKGARTVLHPGYGLSLSEEAEIVKRVNAGGAAETKVRMVRYDEWERLGKEGGDDLTSAGSTVQLSAGGDGEGLPEQGMLPEHLAELIYELVNASLGEGASLVYAGKPGYLQIDLVDVIASAAAEHASKGGSGPQGGTNKETKVRFLTPWRPGVEITASEKVRNLPYCRFEDVYPPPPPGERQPPGVARLRSELEAATELHVWNEAMALSEARRLCAEAATMVVFAGGKRKGWGGVMPGLLEELRNAWSSKSCTHIVILSGFGGAASWLAELTEKPERIDAEVTVEAHLTPGSPFRRLCTSLGADRAQIDLWWGQARGALREIAAQRAQRASGVDPVEGEAATVRQRPIVYVITIDSLRGVRKQIRELIRRAT